MATYTDERNWDQDELDRAREVARENVVTDGSTVPLASKVNNRKLPESAEPAPVLNGERFTTEKEREVVASGALENSEDLDADANAGKAQFEADHNTSEKENTDKES